MGVVENVRLSSCFQVGAAAGRISPVQEPTSKFSPTPKQCSSSGAEAHLFQFSGPSKRPIQVSGQGFVVAVFIQESLDSGLNQIRSAAIATGHDGCAANHCLGEDVPKAICESVENKELGPAIFRNQFFARHSRHMLKEA